MINRAVVISQSEGIFDYSDTGKNKQLCDF